MLLLRELFVSNTLISLRPNNVKIRILVLIFSVPFFTFHLSDSLTLCSGSAALLTWRVSKGFCFETSRWMPFDEFSVFYVSILLQSFRCCYWYIMLTVHISTDLFIDGYRIITKQYWFELQRVFQEAERTAHAWWIANRTKESQNSDAEDLSSQAASEPIANLDWLDFGENRVPLA